MNSKDPRVKTLNPKIGGPLALVLVVGFAVVFFYGWRKGQAQNKEYLANPKIHDIYYTKDDMKRYSVMELVDIKGDEILVQKGDFTVRDEAALHDKEWTFAPAVWIKVSELQRMFDAKEITKIVRPKRGGLDQEITPDPINSSPSYHAANCPGVTPRCGLSKRITVNWTFRMRFYQEVKRPCIIFCG